MAEKHLRKCSSFLVIREMHIKTTLRFHLTPRRMDKIKNTDGNLCWRGFRVKETLLHCWLSVWWFLWKLGSNLPQDPVILLFGIYPKDAHLCHKDMCSAMFIEALFFIARNWKQPKCSSTKEWIRKMWYSKQWSTTQQKKMTSWILETNGWS